MCVTNCAFEFTYARVDVNQLTINSILILVDIAAAALTSPSVAQQKHPRSRVIFFFLYMNENEYTAHIKNKIYLALFNK